RINNFEELVNALKEDISFKMFKITNEEKLQSLRYYNEIRDGDTSKFISKFRKLCYNAEINERDEQKKYFYKSLYLDCGHEDYLWRIVPVPSKNFITYGDHIYLQHVKSNKYLGVYYHHDRLRAMNCCRKSKAAKHTEGNKF